MTYQVSFNFRTPPAEYDPLYLQEVLQEIFKQLSSLAPEVLILAPLNVPPDKVTEGMVANADGTNWNPGGGAGLYQYLSGAWTKM